MTHCPDCGEELYEVSFDPKERQKECPSCDKIFKKKKKAWFRWRMGTEDEFIEEDLNKY